ncbi:MAG: hypothetical protein CMJ40_00515 [Phycisphaerae bacterium]|nr:hypothetical protein [Phycisphaerae bacterium]
MSPFSLLLIAAILLVDGGYGLALSWATPEPWLVFVMAFAPAVVVVLLSWVACRMVRECFVRDGDTTSARRVASGCRLFRYLLILNMLFVILVMDWLSVVRGVAGDQILLDELIAISPLLVASLLMARCWYPVDQIMSNRTVSTLRNGPWRFAWGQFCMEQLLVLVPALLVFGVLELTQTTVVQAWGDVFGQSLLVLGVILVFVSTPLIMRLFLSWKPMASGELRDRLHSVCRRHRVRIREILLWPTGGLILNAAVIGLTGRLRYIVLTETLVDTLPQEYTEAVMAHEVAHVRHVHIPWMFASIVAMVLMIEVVTTPFAHLLMDDVWIQLGLMLVTIGIGFGWISRRFEQQADAFAAVHLSDSSENDVVTLHSVTTVMNSLYSIASLNGAPANRYSWRHGSTAWRCRNLEQIIGCSLSSLPVDRLVSRIKLAIVLVGLISILILVSSSTGVLA